MDDDVRFCQLSPSAACRQRRRRNEASMIRALFRLLIFPVGYRPDHHDSASGRLVSRATGVPVIRRARGRFAAFDPACPSTIAPIPFTVSPAKVSRTTMRLQAEARRIGHYHSAMCPLVTADKVDGRRLSVPQRKRYALKTRVSNRPDRQAPREVKVDHLVDRLDDLRVVGWSEIADWSLHGSGINTHARQRVKPTVRLENVAAVRLAPIGQVGKAMSKIRKGHRLEDIARMLR